METRQFDIAEERGLPDALSFSKQTMRTYRKAVLTKRTPHKGPHFATLPLYRREFIESYLAFKRFCFEHNYL